MSRSFAKVELRYDHLVVRFALSELELCISLLEECVISCTYGPNGPTLLVNLDGSRPTLDSGRLSILNEMVTVLDWQLDGNSNLLLATRGLMFGQSVVLDHDFAVRSRWFGAQLVSHDIEVARVSLSGRLIERSPLDPLKALIVVGLVLERQLLVRTNLLVGMFQTFSPYSSFEQSIVKSDILSECYRFQRLMARKRMFRRNKHRTSQ